jgi:putative Mg2+ transporter-C (MgtC) family protein
VTGTERLLAALGLPIAWAATFQVGLLLRLCLAGLLGGTVGLERELSGKPAGLRASLLLCMGTSLLTEMSIRFAISPTVGAAAGHGDPGRVVAQVVVAVGLMGAAAIIQSRSHAAGLTHAATLWMLCAVGMAVGSRAYVEAVGATVLVLLVLGGLGGVEGALLRRRAIHRYHFFLDPDPALLEAIHRTFREAGLEVESETVEKDALGFRATFEVYGPAFLHREIARAVVARPGVHRMSRSG